MEPTPTLGAYLRELRGRCEPKVTLDDVAARLGVQKSAVSKIENDAARPFADQLDRYLDAVAADDGERRFALELAGEHPRAPRANDSPEAA